MLLLTLSLLLTAEPLQKLKVGAPGLNTTGLEPSVAAPLTEHLARAIVGVQVVTPRDIGALVGLERQKVLLGCSEESSQCMAELGDALGVEGVLMGDVLKLGGAVQIHARIVDPVTGKLLASAAARVEDDDQIFDALLLVGKKLSAQFLTAMGRAPVELPPPPEVSASRGSKRFFPIPLVAGVLAAAAGAGFLVLSEGAWQRLTRGEPESVSPVTATLLARDGQLYQVLGATAVTVGAAALVAGFGLLLFGSERAPTVTLRLGPNSVTVLGRF